MKMKFRIAALLFGLIVFLFPILCACSSSLSDEGETKESKTEEKPKKEETVSETKKEEESKYPLAPAAEEADVASLNALYAGRTAYFGDLHCHPMAGVSKDGKKTLAQWKEKMKEQNMDFVAFMNHHQVAHMYESDWDDTLFIGGTEPAATISDSPAQKKSIHYNMLIPDPTDLLELLEEFPEYNYTGGKDGIAYNKGTFGYPSFTTARMQELIQAVKDKGGLWVNVHPKQQMESDNPEHYYFADYTGLEVFYTFNEGITGQDTKDNYKLWRQLLSRGKRLWATAGADSHNDATNSALTCIYSEAQKDDAYLSHLSAGDFVCGFAGIRMAIGDAKMGSSTDFKGKRVVFSVGEIHSLMYREGRDYTVKVFAGEKVVYTATYNGIDTATFAFDADESAPFYRVEILDERRGTQPIIAIGQPIWND